MTGFFKKSYKNTRTREEWSEPVLDERRVRIISGGGGGGGGGRAAARQQTVRRTVCL